MTNTQKSLHLRLLILLATLGFVIFCAIALTACGGKKDPTYTVPEGLTATFGQTLEDVELPDGFSWEDPITTSVGNVGEHDFNVTYTPEDTDAYNTITGIEVTILVTPANLAVPTGLTAVYGQTLADVSLPNNWTWAVDSATSVGDAGKQTFTVNYTGSDAQNYSNTTNVEITITVAKADPQVTAPTFTETYDIHTTLSQIAFEDERFSWKEPGTTLSVGTNQYVAIFTPDDSKNYNTVEVSVEITGGYIMPQIASDLGETEFSITNASISNTLGNDVTPTINVGGLVEGEDYQITWQYYNEKKTAWENLSYHVGFAAGEYKAIIKGINNYAEQQKEATFTVTKTDFNGTIEIQSLDFNVNEGGTVANITIKELENYFGTLTWDTKDSAYSTPFEVGENVRYANITGGRNYNAKNHVAVTIVVAKSIKNFEEFKSALQEGVTELYITGTTVVKEDITVPKGVSIRVKKGVNFTVNGGTLTMEGFSVVNEGKINTRATYSALKGDFVIIANTANNVMSAINSGFVSKIVLNKDINFIENQVWTFTNTRTLDIDLNGFNINGSIAITTNDYNTDEPQAVVSDKINIKLTNSKESGGKITGVMTSNVNYALFVEGNAEALTVTLENVALESAGFALVTNGLYSGASIVATDSTFTSTFANKVAVYLPADYAVTFTNCQISGSTGVYVRDGNVTITQSTITATGDYAEPVYVLGQAQSIGSAVVIDSAYQYSEEITVAVTGSTINSTNGYGIHEIKTAPEGQAAQDVATVTQSDNTFNTTKGETIILN